MKNFVTVYQSNKKEMQHFVTSNHLDGTEAFIASIVPRENVLFVNSEEENKLLHELRGMSAKRIHMSYWAEPSDFLEKIDRKSLVRRFGSEEDVIKYYCDLTGEHIYNRWVQEYALAKDLGAEAVTFHMIDYFHIDGLWEFTNTKKDILKALTHILQRLLNSLEKEGLLEKGPTIELENAGFGLEYGAQTVEDFQYVFNAISDKFGKVKIGWDINHLLHAVGCDTQNKKAKFFLTPQEITPEMEELERNYGDEYDLFCLKWLEYNILDSQLLDKVGSIHLSDAPKKTEAIFSNGQMTGEYLKKLQSLKTDEEKEEYGVEMVLGYYDAHLPFERMQDILLKLIQLENSGRELSIIHELKGKENLEDKLSRQIALVEQYQRRA